jgi:peptidoglycan/LPS O-acetylase OafA/YrhL
VSLATRVLARPLETADTSVLFDQNLLRRYWEWVLGCVIAERLVADPRVDRAPRWLFIALLAGSYVVGVVVLRLPFGGAIQTAVWPALFALCIECACRLRVPEPGAVVRATVWVGWTSYSLYLIHPVGLALGIFLANQAGAPWAATVLVGLIGAIVVWTLFFYGVERPFLSRSVRSLRAVL